MLINVFWKVKRKAVINAVLAISLTFLITNCGQGEVKESVENKTEEFRKPSMNIPQTFVREGFNYYSAYNMKSCGKYHEEEGFDRLPKKFNQKVEPIIWNLSSCSAGISLLFKTNSPTISARWVLKNNSSLANLSKVATCGVDLYAKKAGKWKFVNVGVPQGYINESLILENGDSSQITEYKLNLPSYDGIEDLEIGVLQGFEFDLKIENSFENEGRIVCYGSSITQGACASRPGATYPHILSREKEMEVVNLGYSGNGLFAKSLAEVICDIDDVKVIVVECIPNSKLEGIQKYGEAFLEMIRGCHQNASIILVEGMLSSPNAFKTVEDDQKSAAYVIKKNESLNEIYASLKKNGDSNIYYLPSSKISIEGAFVDYIHPSDVGHKNLAAQLGEIIGDVL